MTDQAVNKLPPNLMDINSVDISYTSKRPRYDIKRYNQALMTGVHMPTTMLSVFNQIASSPSTAMLGTIPIIPTQSKRNHALDHTSLIYHFTLDSVTNISVNSPIFRRDDGELPDKYKLRDNIEPEEDSSDDDDGTNGNANGVAGVSNNATVTTSAPIFPPGMLTAQPTDDESSDGSVYSSDTDRIRPHLMRRLTKGTAIPNLNFIGIVQSIMICKQYAVLSIVIDGVATLNTHSVVKYANNIYIRGQPIYTIDIQENPYIGIDVRVQQAVPRHTRQTEENSISVCIGRLLVHQTNNNLIRILVDTTLSIGD